MYERIIRGADGIDYKITSSSNIAELVISVGYGLVKIGADSYSVEDNLCITTVETKTLEEAPMIDIMLLGFDYKKEKAKHYIEKEIENVKRKNKQKKNRGNGLRKSK